MEVVNGARSASIRCYILVDRSTRSGAWQRLGWRGGAPDALVRNAVFARQRPQRLAGGGALLDDRAEREREGEPAGCGQAARPPCALCMPRRREPVMLADAAPFPHRGRAL